MAQAKSVSKSQKVRNMLAKGHDVSYIARTLNVKPQMVYNIRWRMNKKVGLGAIAPNTIVVPPATPEQLFEDAPSKNSRKPRKARQQEKPSFIQRLFAAFRGW